MIKMKKALKKIKVKKKLNGKFNGFIKIRKEEN